jgi:alginate O-acetyltransferase complex protein AlgI
MLFNSPVFLFIFLPIFLLVYFISSNLLRNLTLLFASIIFYFWGQPDFIFILVGLIYINYFFARLIEKNKNRLKAKKTLYIIIFINLGVLVYYKYRLFILSNLIFIGINLPKKILLFISSDFIFLPLAISFFIFHAISYQIDVFRKESKAEKNLIKLALYFLMFPHLLAGPILRYHQIEKALAKRSLTLNNSIIGITRFVTGLAKKVLIADRLASVSNEVFAIPGQNMDISTAWLGLVCFSLQIYFDFSAYSDMAIGLAKIMGFSFPENFNYPYIASSIKEFWRRWHITLSNWFRDYVYIPLGGNRVENTKIYINLMIVFLLCGLWHGARWNFVIWGVIHGIFLVIERIKDEKLIKIIGKPLGHLYTLIVVSLSWVFFRTETFDQAIQFLKTLFGFNNPVIKYRPFEYFISYDLLIILAIAIFLSFRLHIYIGEWLNKFTNKYLISLVKGTKFIYPLVLLFLSFITLASQTYKSFIYFKF